MKPPRVPSKPAAGKSTRPVENKATRPGFLGAVDGLIDRHYLIALRVAPKGRVYFIPDHWRLLSIREAPEGSLVGTFPGLAPGVYYIHNKLRDLKDLKNYFLY